MKIRNTKVFLLVEANRNIRKEIFQYEEKLKESFKVPFINTNIPEEADPNIIRFYSNSLNYHSNIQVAQNKIILDTVYDKGFEDDILLVYDYLKNKLSILTQLINKETINSIGITSILDFEMDISQYMPLIKELTSFSIIDKDIKELRYFYSKVYKNNFYANITISQYARFLLEKLPDLFEQNNTIEMKKESQGIQVMIDFNNKPLVSNKKEFEYVLDSFSKLIKENQLNNYIKGELL
jgi:hypothetical protein